MIYVTWTRKELSYVGSLIFDDEDILYLTYTHPLEDITHLLLISYILAIIRKIYKYNLRKL